MPWPMRSALPPSFEAGLDLARKFSTAQRQRDELLAALKQIVATDFLKNESGVRQAIPVRWNRALEIAYAAIEKADGKR